MILGVGIDTVDIDRFTGYASHSTEMLQKMFSMSEIDYCLSKPNPAPHFASRFAAREAFFKAYQGMLCHYEADHPANLFTINKNIEVVHTPHGVPYINAAWHNLLPEQINPPYVHLSITHTRVSAMAFIIMNTT